MFNEDPIGEEVILPPLPTEIEMETGNDPERELEQAIAAAEDLLEEAIREEDAAKRKRDDTYEQLATSIENKLTKRIADRGYKEGQWSEALQLYYGSLADHGHIEGDYRPGEPQREAPAARRPDVNIVRNKCDIAVSQTIAYQFSAGDKNWEINPPATYDDVDPQELEQMAQMGQPMDAGKLMAYRADLMSKEIESHLENTNYASESRKAMWDRVVLGSGILKGPSNTGRPKKVYRKITTSEGKIIRVPEITLESAPYITRVNPWYFFPDCSEIDIAKAEDCIEIHPMNKMELKELMQREDFFGEQLQACLEEEPRNYNLASVTSPSYGTGSANLVKGKYVVSEYHGPIRKDDMDNIGVGYDIDTPYEELYAEVWVCNGRIIKFSLSNLEGYQRIPYCVSVWEKDPSSPFGFGIPMLMRDQQRVVTETYKMVLDNAGISAGPQVVVDTTIVKPLDGKMEITPFKVWLVSDFGADTSKAITFFTPPNSFEGLASLLQLAKGFGDEESSIPLFLSGTQTPTGVDSATGFAMLNQNATSPLFYKAEQWDDDVTSPIIQMTYDWEMQFNPKEDIKGTFSIDVRTSTSFLRNQQDQSKLERLAQEIAQGGPSAEWINMDTFTQARLMGMRLPFKGLMKSPEQVEQERAQRPEPPPDPQLIMAQNDQKRVELEGQKLQIETQKVAIEAQNSMQQAQLKFQTDMATVGVRTQEAQASVLKGQSDRDIALLNLAQKDEGRRQELLARASESEANRQSKEFLAGIQAEQMSKQQQQKDVELQIKAAQVNRRDSQQR